MDGFEFYGLIYVMLKLRCIKDFANYKDEALEVYPTIVYACSAVFWRHWLFWLFESLTINIKTLDT